MWLNKFNFWLNLWYTFAAATIRMFEGCNVRWLNLKTGSDETSGPIVGRLKAGDTRSRNWLQKSAPKA